MHKKNVYAAAVSADRVKLPKNPIQRQIYKCRVIWKCPKALIRLRCRAGSRLKDSAEGKIRQKQVKIPMKQRKIQRKLAKVQAIQKTVPKGVQKYHQIIIFAKKFRR